MTVNLFYLNFTYMSLYSKTKNTSKYRDMSTYAQRYGTIIIRKIKFYWIKAHVGAIDQHNLQYLI
jgi:hypothetical protein